MRESRRFRDYVMQFSYQENRKRRMKCLKEELAFLNNMDKDELYFEYMERKEAYEHQKNVLTFFLISIALAILSNVWSKFFSFMVLAIQYAARSNDMAVVWVSFWISVSVLAFITLIMFFFLFSLLRDMRKAKRRFMVIEDVIRKVGEVTENDCEER